MKETVTVNDMRDRFQAFERYNTFSYDGYQVLFDYLEEYEQDSGQEIELDVIALCCEYSESTSAEIAANYDITLDPDESADMDDDEKAELLQEAVINYLHDHTSVCGLTEAGTIVYAQF